MSRLFISLYISLAIGLGAFIFGVIVLPERVLQGIILDFGEDIYRGTIHLLDERMSKAADKEQALRDIEALPGYPIRLQPLEELSLSDQQKQRLVDGQMQKQEIDNANFLFFRSFDPKKFWVLQTEQTDNEEAELSARSTGVMLRNKLSAFPQDQWPAEIDKLKANFGIPLSMITLADIDSTALNDQQKQLLIQGKVAHHDLSEPNETFYFLVEGTDAVLIAGPLGTPFLLRYLEFIVLAILCLLIGAIIFLWIKPLWNNLQSLKKATLSFGRGNFNIRASTSKRSPIVDISQSFNSMAERIQRLISSHKELTNAVSHELRTPLARLRFSLEMIESSKDNDHQKRYLNEMHIDINELDSLINELLTYARFEREKPELDYQPVPIRHWFEQQINRANHLAHPLNISLEFEDIDVEDHALFESRLLGRALSNLINNAIRYANSAIVVSVSQKDQSFSFSVDDDGPGIPDTVATDIFQPFKRADSSRDRDTGGFGLGLSIVKQVIEWHQGNIRLAKPVLGGARFIIDLPLQPK